MPWIGAARTLILPPTTQCNIFVTMSERVLMEGVDMQSLLLYSVEFHVPATSSRPQRLWTTALEERYA